MDAALGNVNIPIVREDDPRIRIAKELMYLPRVAKGESSVHATYPGERKTYNYFAVINVRKDKDTWTGYAADPFLAVTDTRITKKGSAEPKYRTMEVSAKNVLTTMQKTPWKNKITVTTARYQFPEAKQAIAYETDRIAPGMPYVLKIKPKPPKGTIELVAGKYWLEPDAQAIYDKRGLRAHRLTEELREEMDKRYPYEVDPRRMDAVFKKIWDEIWRGKE